MTAELDRLDIRAATPAHLAFDCTRHLPVPWTFYPHLRILQRYFMLLWYGVINRLMIFMPPQHGKSMFISGWCVKWMLMQNPYLRVAVSSYVLKLAKRWGRSALDFFGEVGPEYNLPISHRAHAAEDWSFSDGGSMISVGVGGLLTGMPVDFGIIDDPIKGFKEANSPAYREGLKDWYAGSFMTRLSKLAKVCIINTRWHEDDICAWLLSLAESGMGEPFTVLNLPAIAPYPDEIPMEEHPLFFPDAMGREPGEPLCPELHPLHKLQAARQTLGDVKFWALFQGRPRPGRGGMFTSESLSHHWEDAELPITWDSQHACWYYPDKRNTFDDVIQSWDCKFAEIAKSTGCYVAGGVWARKGTRKYLLDQVRGRWGVEETIEQVKELNKKWGLICGAKLFEAKAAGPEIIRRLESQISGMIPMPVEGDKIRRAMAVEHHFRASLVLLPHRSRYGWVHQYKQEMESFPRGIYTDQVDQSTQALDYLQQRETIIIPQASFRPDPFGRLRA